MARTPINKQKASDPSELKIALDNRAFEIQLLWQRSNYFLVLITALGIGVFSIRDREFASVISVAAAFSSYFWFRTNLGSRFWQESWEAEVVILAKEQKIRSFERPSSEITQQVEAALEGNHSRSWIRRWTDRQILKKPSVSYNMILLSLTFTLMWSVISLFFLWQQRIVICSALLSIVSWLERTWTCLRA